MPSVLMYALAPELRTVIEHLNDDADVAFIMADGPANWRAVDRVQDLAAGHHALWLRQQGPAPPVISSTAGFPFFGSHPAIVWFDVPRFDQTAAIPISAFGWIGDRYRTTGLAASPAARAWWRRLREWIRARTELVKRGGPGGTGPKDVAAFPEALALLRPGAEGDLTPPTL